MSKPPELDHVVIDTRYQLDQAKVRFGDMGFQLTERGHHSMGSINHLMVFSNSYIELLGLPVESVGDSSVRPDLARAPLGIGGLVFRSFDISETFRHLQRLDMAANPPKSFSRPVTSSGGVQEARFQTVNVRDSTFPGRRVYFCMHHTPELVWPRNSANHRNGALDITEIVVVSPNQVRETELFAKLLGSEVAESRLGLSIGLHGARIIVMTAEVYADQFGDLASTPVGPESMFGAVVVRTRDPATVRRIAGEAGLEAREYAGRLIVRESTFNTVIEFID